MKKRSLQAHDLYKAYQGKAVIEGVSLALEQGEILGLLGPNGAGKTTCFYMLVGLILPDQGQIWLDGKNISALPLHRRARLGIGYLPQEASIFRRLTVAENLLAILQLQALNATQREQRLQQLLQDFEIAHLRNSMGNSLSGGERRRTEIARALAASPGFLFLDEPFAGIDPVAIGDIKKLIRQLAEQGIGILITDHNVRDTLSVCDRVCILNAHKILATGSPQDILANQKVHEVYLGDSFHP